MEYPSAAPRGKRPIPFWCRQAALAAAGFLTWVSTSAGLCACAGRGQGEDAQALPAFGPADAVLFDDPGFSAVHELGSRLVAKKLVLFLKRYNGGPGVGTLRWHAEPDSAALHAAVQRAVPRPH
ncbi:MAG TPA: hypothetical protein VI072_04405 [Polyangiaceae bacterium]